MISMKTPECSDLKVVILIPSDDTEQFKYSVNKENVYFTDFINKPILYHTIDSLISSGCNKLLFTGDISSRNREKIEEHLKVYKDLVEYEFVNESIVRTLSEAFISVCNKLTKEEPFLILNGATIFDFPISHLLKSLSKNPDKISTTVIVPMNDEKCPKDQYNKLRLKNEDPLHEFINRNISLGTKFEEAGIYLFRGYNWDKTILKKVANGVELEVNKEVFQYECDSRYMCFNIYSDYEYLNATKAYLMKKIGSNEDTDKTVVIHSTARVGNSCKLGPYVVLGPNSKVEDGVRLKNVVTFENSEIRSGAYIENTIVGQGVKIGRWVRIEGSISIINANIEVKDEVFICS